MRPKQLILRAEDVACVTLIGIMAIALPVSVRAEPAPSWKCIAVVKQEYDSAKKKHLLHTRMGTYVRTGRPWRRYYWYCQP